MTAWWYWALFALVAVGVFAGPPLCSWLAARADDRDAEAWSRIPGAIQ